MRFFKRYRWWGIWVLPALIILLNSFGPDSWREPLVRVVWLSWAFIAVSCAHAARKVLFDYADGRKAWLKALESPAGAGLAFLGLCLLGGCLVLAFAGFAKADAVEKAKPLLPLVREEIERAYPAIPSRSYIGALIEVETCITPTHKFCWSPSARLKTSREEGAGLGQLTRAWRADGSLRFDALGEVKKLAGGSLDELNWENVYTRADLGVRAILVMTKDCHRKVGALFAPAPQDLLAFCDAAYNGGFAGMLQDRRLCGLVDGCDPKKWFGHTEGHSSKSKVKWQGYGLSAFEINRSHVKKTVQWEPLRIKYSPYLGV